MTEGKFMVAVGAVIENRITGKILLLQRTSRSDFLPGVWEAPSGRMKQFEELEEALHRELSEEAGIKGFCLNSGSSGIYRYFTEEFRLGDKLENEQCSALR